MAKIDKMRDWLRANKTNVVPSLMKAKANDKHWK